MQHIYKMPYLCLNGVLGVNFDAPSNIAFEEAIGELLGGNLLSIRIRVSKCRRTGNR